MALYFECQINKKALLHTVLCPLGRESIPTVFVLDNAEEEHHTYFQLISVLPQRPSYLCFLCI